MLSGDLIHQGVTILFIFKVKYEVRSFRNALWVEKAAVGLFQFIVNIKKL